MKVLAIIPARAGSKRLPGKNKMLVGGEQLWRKACQVALGAGLQDVVVATDDQGIIRGIDLHSAEEQGFGRLVLPPVLTGDDVAMGSVVSFVTNEMEHFGDTRYAAVVLLQPTSPLRTASDVSRCIQIMLKTDCDSVVSVVGERDLRGHVRYEHNGAVYVTTAANARYGVIIGGHAQFYVMPPERSVDIDTAADLEEARRLAGG